MALRAAPRSGPFHREGPLHNFTGADGTVAERNDSIHATEVAGSTAPSIADLGRKVLASPGHSHLPDPRLTCPHMMITVKNGAKAQ